MGLLKLRWTDMIFIISLALLHRGLAEVASANCTAYNTRFLRDIISKSGWRNVALLSFRDMCGGTVVELHAHQSFTLQTYISDLNTERRVQVIERADFVVILLRRDERDLSLAISQAVDYIDHIPRRTPVVVIGAAKSKGQHDKYVSAILEPLQRRNWWTTSIALMYGELAQGRGTAIRISWLKDLPDNKVTEGESEVLVFKSQPFANGHRCGEWWGPSALAARWNATTAVLVEEPTTCQQPVQKLNGCTVTVAVSWNPPYVYYLIDSSLAGFDIKVLRYFGESKNVSVDILQPNVVTNESTLAWRRTYIEGFNPAAYLRSGAANMAIGGIRIQRAATFDYCQPYTQDAALCYLSRIRTLPRWTYPIAVLSAEMWAGVLGIALSLVTILTCTTNHGVSYNAVVVIGVLLESSSIPKYKCRQLRFIVILWVLFCLHFNSGYRSLLAMANVGRLEEKGLDRIEDAQKILTMEVGNNVTVPRYLWPRIEVCSDPTICAKIVRAGLPFTALVMQEETMGYLYPTHFADGRGRPLLQPAQRRLGTDFLVALLPKDSPLLPQLDDAFTRGKEMGLFAKWLQDERTMTMRKVVAKSRGRNTGPKPIDLARLVGPFASLITGLLLSIILFGGEITYKKVSSHPYTI